MSLLYQKGVADNLILNAVVKGKTSEGHFSLDLVEPLNFSDSTIKLEKGWATLKEHSVTGTARMTVLYSLRGKSATAAAAATSVEEGEGASEPADAEAGEEAVTEDSDQRPFGIENLISEFVDEGMRMRRTTQGPAKTLSGALAAGVTFRKWIDTINTAMNKRYYKEFGRLDVWPMTCVVIETGQTRLASSVFARLAVSDVRFWWSLGFTDDQLETIDVELDAARGQPKVALPMLAPYLDERGECLSENPLPADVARKMMTAEAVFAYVPTNDRDIELEFEHDMLEKPATPKGMTEVFQSMVRRTNYKYRHELLNRPPGSILLIGPRRIVKLTDEDGRLAVLPLNIFPISMAATDTGDGLELHVNTKEGQGAIVSVSLPENNCFGLPPFIFGYTKDKFASVHVLSSRRLGVVEQHCTVTSSDLHMSRTLVRPALSSQCLVAVFPSDLADNDTPHLPLNRLSANTTYDRINFRVFSTTRESEYKVSKEVYSYLFIFEIRSYS